jgi:hypothetical protein
MVSKPPCKHRQATSIQLQQLTTKDQQQEQHTDARARRATSVEKRENKYTMKQQIPKSNQHKE